MGDEIMDAVKEQIEKTIKQNKIVIFMKGNKNFPQCGFSAAVVEVFNSLHVPFVTIDVLADPNIRQGIKDYTNWPTIPQVFIDGEFIGGSDIIRELHASGELKKKIEKALA